WRKFGDSFPFSLPETAAFFVSFLRFVSFYKPLEVFIFQGASPHIFLILSRAFCRFLYLFTKCLT
ncbi:hypothetical protein, partial [Acutalibacter muris]|uniref:hypothetical protein n=1 Tax=Acutalibacter muris TaxID=1796620 RepID=UPI001C3EF31D